MFYSLLSSFHLLLFFVNWNANLETWVIYSILCAQFIHELYDVVKCMSLKDVDIDDNFYVRCDESKFNKLLHFMFWHVSISSRFALCLRFISLSYSHSVNKSLTMVKKINCNIESRDFSLLELDSRLSFQLRRDIISSDR